MIRKIQYHQSLNLFGLTRSYSCHPTYFPCWLRAKKGHWVSYKEDRDNKFRTINVFRLEVTTILCSTAWISNDCDYNKRLLTFKLYNSIKSWGFSHQNRPNYLPTLWRRFRSLSFNLRKELDQHLQKYQVNTQMISKYPETY